MFCFPTICIPSSHLLSTQCPCADGLFSCVDSHQQIIYKKLCLMETGSLGTQLSYAADLSYRLGQLTLDSGKGWSMQEFNHKSGFIVI